MFSWRKKENAPDEHAATPGAADSAPAAGTVSAHTADSARANALELSAKSPRARGRPRNAERDGGNDRADLQKRLDAEIARQLDAIHDPKAWGALLGMPGDVGLALTGREHWNIKGEERATLGACGSAFARTMMITNPQGLAALMLASGLLMVYMPRATLELKHWRDERAKKNAQKPAEEKK